MQNGDSAKQTKTAPPLPNDEHSGKKVIWFCNISSKMVFLSWVING
jgi:hypothetical protein